MKRNRIGVHPGEILREDFMKPRGLSAHALGQALLIGRDRIFKVVACERNISADTALRLARYFGTTPEFWMNLQSAYDLAVARAAAGKQIEKIRPVKLTEV